MADAAEIKRLEEKVGDHQFHHVECDVFKEMTLEVSGRAKRHPELFETLAIPSTKTIGEGLKACAASPFKTVFVVREKTGEVLFALSQNEDYVVHARKKKPKPPTPTPPPPPISDCCRLCGFRGGTGCDDMGGGFCICFGADHSTNAGIDDELEVLAF